MMDPKFQEALTRGDINSLKQTLQDNPRILYGLTAQNNTALHIAASLGYVWSVTEIMNRHPSFLWATNSKGNTPLHCAAGSGHDFIVAFLVRRIQGSIDDRLMDSRFWWKNKWGNTPLHEAVRNRHLGAAMQLVKAEPELCGAVNEFGESALYLAAERGDVNIVRLLLEFSAMCDAGGRNGQTALHAAVCRSHDVAQLLLEKRPELNERADASQSTPLHYAASNGDQKMVQLLLRHHASTAYLLDKDGLSAIHIASKMGYLDIICEIIQHCPGAVELTDTRGRNFIHVAIENRRATIVKYVLKVPVLKELLNEPDHSGNTPMHLATINHNLDIVHLMLANGRIDTTARNYKGLTPLDLASVSVNSNIRIRMHKIMVQLVSAGSQFSPQRMDLMTNKFHRKQEEEVNRCRALANNLAIVAVLIATVTFAAAFTLPGGYKNDDGPNQGIAILAKKAAFKAFLVSDAVAMVSSIMVTCLLIYTGSLDHDVRLHSISTAMNFMWVALGGMVVAFATGTYVVVVSESKWLAILICIITCSVPFLAWVIACWPSFGSLRLVELARNRGMKFRKSAMFKVVDFQMPRSIVVDFETPPGSKSGSLPV